MIIKKKHIVIAGLLFTALAYAGKKAKELLDLSNKLSFDIAGLHSVNLKNKTAQVNLKITNPTPYDLDVSRFLISKIQLYLPNENKPFAISETPIKNVVLTANSEVVIPNIEFKVNLNIGQFISLLSNFKQIKVATDVQAFGLKQTLSIQPLSA